MSTSELFLKTVRSTFELLFPSDCDFCETALNQEDYFRVCQKCVDQLTLETHPSKCMVCLHPIGQNGACPACSKLQLGVKNYRTLFYNDGFGKEFLQAYKFERRKSYVRVISDLLEKELPYLNSFDFLLPFPLAKGALFKRDFDPILEPLKKIKSNLKVPIIPALIKKKKTTMQHLLPLSERTKNVKGVYSLNPKWKTSLENKKVLIVDDILTSGASLNEVTDLLMREVPGINVSAFTFARSVLA